MPLGVKSLPSDLRASHGVSYQVLWGRNLLKSSCLLPLWVRGHFQRFCHSFICHKTWERQDSKQMKEMHVLFPFSFSPFLLSLASWGSAETHCCSSEDKGLTQHISLQRHSEKYFKGEKAPNCDRFTLRNFSKGSV